MELPGKVTRIKPDWVIWGYAILFFLLFSYLIPKTCDDWIFTARLQSTSEHGGLIGVIAHEWRTLNGRVLGNGLSIALSGSKLLRVLFRTAVYASLLFAMGRLTKFDRWKGAGLALTFVVMLLVPDELRKQTYAWDSGFVNYAVPAALLFLYLLLILPLFSGERIQGGVWRLAASLLLGFCSTLFVENVTILALFLGLGTTVWYFVQQRRVSSLTVCFFIGALTGTVLLLSSPTYAVTISGDDAYRAIPTTLPALLARVKSNYEALSCESFGDYKLLHLLLSGGCLAVLYRKNVSVARPAQRLRAVLTVLLCALPVYFLMTTRQFDYVELRSAAFAALVGAFSGFYPAMALDLVAYGLYVLSVVCVLLFYVPDLFTRRLGIACVASALAAGLPMLLVWPIDYRCFLPTYLFWAVTALLLVKAALPDTDTLPKTVSRCIYACMAAVCCCNLMLYASCPKIERARCAYMEQQMSIEAPVIVLPEFDSEPYLHYPTAMMSEYYHYSEPGDIEMPFIPYEEWNETFSSGLSEEEIAAYEATH